MEQQRLRGNGFAAKLWAFVLALMLSACALPMAASFAYADDPADPPSSGQDANQTGDVNADVWDGAIDVSWYNTTNTEFTLTKPAQLAGLAYITSPKSGTATEFQAWVNGSRESMAEGITVDSFAGKTVKLGADIDMNGSENLFTKPISDVNNTDPKAGGQGSSDGTFSDVAWQGTFDGQGHTVKNIYMDGRKTAAGNYGGYQGLFSGIGEGAKIQKVGVTGKVWGRVIGGIASISEVVAKDSSVEKYPLIQNCWSDVWTQGNGSGTRPTGGIFGGEGTRHNCVHIINCYAKGRSHNGQSAGGVAGFVNGTVSGCYYVGSTVGNNTGAVVATLTVLGYYGSDIPESQANGYWGKNTALTGSDANGNLYRYADKSGGDSSPTKVTTGFQSANNLKGNYYYQYLHDSSVRSARTDEAYAKDTGNINGGYPILYWQANVNAKEIDLSGATIADIPDQVYTAKRIEPELTVTLNGLKLVRGTDYIAKFEDNVEVGEGTAKVTLYGVGRYFGTTATKTFTVSKFDLTNTTITAVPNQWRYGDVVEPVLQVFNDKGTRLVKDKDFAVEYENNNAEGKATAKVVPLLDTEGNPLQLGENSVDFYITDAADHLEGSGTADDPYQLTNRGELQFLAHVVDEWNVDAGYLGAYYQVMNDIDCTPADPETQAYNKPIGSDGSELIWYGHGASATSYQQTHNRGWWGTFDGDGHTITLAMTDASAWGPSSSVALFGHIGKQFGNGVVKENVTSNDVEAVVKNLTLAGKVERTATTSALGGGNAAGLVGYQYFGGFTVQDVVNKADISTQVSSGIAAGIGYEIGGLAKLTNVVNEGTIESKGYASGIVAYKYQQSSYAGQTDVFKQVHNKGKVTSSGGIAAGIIGHMQQNYDGLLSQCSNTGDITGTSTAGGIWGSHDYASVNPKKTYTLDSCFNSGTITATSASGSAGGLDGAMSNYLTENLFNCYNVGSVNAPSSNNQNAGVGGFTGTFRMPNNVNANAEMSGYNAGAISKSGASTKQGAIIGYSQVSNTSPSRATFDGLWLEQDGLDVTTYGTGNYTKPVGGTHSAISADDLKGVAALDTLGSAFVADQDNVNNGYPVLFWQVDGADPFDIAEATAEVEPLYETGDALKPAFTLTYEGAQLVEGKHYRVVGYSDNVEAGTGKIQVEGLGRFGGTTATVEFVIQKFSLKNATIADIDDQAYTGSAVEPALKVTAEVNGKTLTLKEGVDYDVAFTGNTGVGTATARIAGIGHYKGSQKKGFNIVSAGDLDEIATIAAIDDQVYTGAAIEPAIQVTLADGTALAEGADYTVQFKKNTDVGKANVHVDGIGGYDGTLSATFNIVAAPLDTLELSGVEDVYAEPAEGETVTVAPVLTNAAGNQLVAGEDYTVSILDAKNGKEADADALGARGSFKLVLEAAGTNYSGTVEKPFEIGNYLVVYRQLGDNGTPQVAKTYTRDEFLALKSDSDDPVSGMFFKGSVWHITSSDNYVLLDDLIADAGLSGDWKPGAKISYGGDPLQGKQTQVFDYDTFTGMSSFFPKTAGANVDFDTVRAAPAVLTITEMSGESSNTYSCDRLEADNVANANANNEPRLIYGVAKADLQADPSEWGGATTRGMRYWSNNEQVTIIVPDPDADDDTNAELAAAIEDAKKALDELAVSEDGTDVREGSAWVGQETYDALKQAIADAEAAQAAGGLTNSKVASIVDALAAAKANAADAKQDGTKPGPTSLSPDKQVLVDDQTYTGKELTPEPTVIIKGVTLKKGTDYDVSYKNNVKAGTATVIISGKGEYSGDMEQTFTIKAKSLKKAKVSNVKAKVYTGKKITQAPKVVLGGVTLKKGADYTLSYKNNVKAGTAKVTIKGKGNYSGSVTKTFKVKKVSIKKATFSKVKAQKLKKKGTAVKPKVTVKYKGKKLKAGADYKITYKNNKKKGTAKIIIKGKGSFSGSKTIKFKIK